MLPAILAFCGFYVGGADQQLFNDATQVVLMRDGTRTVLSMQNNYKGPPEDFAMVVPVPVVLQEERRQDAAARGLRRTSSSSARRGSSSTGSRTRAAPTPTRRASTMAPRGDDGAERGAARTAARTSA